VFNTTSLFYKFKTDDKDVFVKIFKYKGRRIQILH